jgi:4'-phosphopantetheinyl transferase
LALRNLDSRSLPILVTDHDTSVNLPAVISVENPVAWLHPHVGLTLLPGELHVWRACLDVTPAHRDRFASYLSPEERARGDRFIFPRDRDHFVVARGVLRELLGRYLTEPAENITFGTGKHGKPFLLQGPGRAPIRFNLSHSHGFALYAFALDRELGIDIEQISAHRATQQIAERYFSVAECAELRALPPHLRVEAFFLCWTRKEAYVKAHGEGLHIPLDSFDVSLTPGGPTTLRSKDASGWLLTAFSPAPNFAAACISEVGVCERKFWDLVPSL